MSGCAKDGKEAAVKVRGAGAVVAAAFCLCAARAHAAEAADAGALTAAAEKAKAAGDKIGALRNYTEALCALRAAGAAQPRIDACSAEKDRLTVEILQQIPEMQKQQAEAVQLQRGIAQRIVRIVQIDTDVQARVKKNEDLIKDIETMLLDAVK
jgi:hypothetical protein